MKRRFLINKIVLGLAWFCAILGLSFLLWILVVLCERGIGSLSFSLFTKDLISDGLRNLIIGQLVLSGLACVISIPLGIFAGIYLQEYANHKFAGLIRNLNDVMLSIPSIIIGAFIYILVVIPSGGTNGFAGVLSLAILVLPIVVNTSDNMLSLVPKELREAGIALGASKHKIILNIVLKGAKAGIVTGLLLAFGRVIGETAPLLFTSGTSNFFNLDLTKTFPSLSVSIYNLANNPSQASRNLAWSGAFILTFIVLLINIIGRFLTRNKG